MQKIWLIIKREYLAKVRKKAFILSTVLFPVLYLGLIFGSGYLSEKTARKLKIVISDSSGYFTSEKINAENSIDSSSILTLTNVSPALLEKMSDSIGYDGYIIFPANSDWKTGIKGLIMHTNRTLGLESVGGVQKKLNNIWATVKNSQLGIDEDKKTILENSVISIRPENSKDKNANSGIASIIGVVVAVLIYIILMLYGSQVMMGVTEEKTNRIAEVMVSSVKPFQLMMGKIIGIGLVAFTQILLWISFVLIIYNFSNIAGSSNMNDTVGGIQQVFISSNIPQVLFFFTFYLMGGFFFYASLFAAVGSAVNEDMREAQSLSFPLMMPIIFSMTMLGAVLKDPSGPIAFWGSIIPFSSPIIMMVRIPFGVPTTVPWWQIAVSMTTLIAGFFFTTWFAAKVYRVGILMYGKKASWKELIKWAFRKG